MTIWLGSGNEGEILSDWEPFDSIADAQSANKQTIALIIEIGEGLTPDLWLPSTADVCLVYDYNGWREPNRNAQHWKEWWNA